MDYSSFYKQVSKHYNISRLDEPKVFEYTVNYIAKTLKDKYGSILDVGCGTGEYGNALLQKGYKVIGVDKSSEQVRIASKKIRAFQGDILSLDFYEKSFDAIILIMMIHQIEHNKLGIAFDKLYNVLKNNGLIIIRTCFKDDLINRLTSKYFPSCLEFDLKRYPSLKQILFSAPRFQLIESSSVSISIDIKKDQLIKKLKLRGASNIGILSNEELNNGIDRLILDYKDSNIIKTNIDCSFVVLKKRL